MRRAGHSPESLAIEIFERSGEQVSGRTIRRSIDEGVVPYARGAAAIANWLEKDPVTFWAR